MSERVLNFTSGPSMLPEPVLERAGAEITSLGGLGAGVMEISHRSRQFAAVLEKAERGIRELMRLPDDLRVLFLSGGATLQFTMVPMNLLSADSSADYLVTGAWGKKAVEEARPFGRINVVFDSSASGFRSVPQQDEVALTSGAAYVHYTSNETIDGVEFPYDLDAHGVPVVCDASSNILSKPIDITKYDLIYAGAQKNIGPSGVTVVIIREGLFARIPRGLPSLMDYRTFADSGSMPNTPNTWGVYMIGLVCDWLKEQGGVEAMAERNREKATLIYDTLDSSDGFYSGHAERVSRSLMNVTFRLQDETLEEKFCSEAESAGMIGLRGHRTVGGVRASIYNAMPLAGVERLVGFMKDFASRNG